MSKVNASSIARVFRWFFASTFSGGIHGYKIRICHRGHSLLPMKLFLLDTNGCCLGSKAKKNKIGTRSKRLSDLSLLCAPACLVMDTALEFRLASTVTACWSNFVPTPKPLSENWLSLIHSVTDLRMFWELGTEMGLVDCKIHLSCSAWAWDEFASAMHQFQSLLLLDYYESSA